MSNYIIRSPLAGSFIKGETQIAVGSIVAAGQALCNIHCIAKIETETQKVHLANGNVYISQAGIKQAHSSVPIKSPIEGRIIKTYVQCYGMDVKKDQPLFEIEPT